MMKVPWPANRFEKASASSRVGKALSCRVYLPFALGGSTVDATSFCGVGIALGAAGAGAFGTTASVALGPSGLGSTTGAFGAAAAFAAGDALAGAGLTATGGA